MITKSERIYFTEPLGTCIVPSDWSDAKVLITSVRYPHRDITVGDIVDVNGYFVDDKAGFWYVTSVGGRHVEGHLVSYHDYSHTSRYRIGIISDHLFIFGSHVDRDDDFKRSRLQITRWSDTSLPLNAPTEYGMFHLSAMAAPWASELMPRPGELEDVVRAKVKLAQLRFEQKRKAIQIVKEGYERSWLNLLEVLNNEHLAYMGYPRFNLDVRGQALIPVPTEVASEQVLAAARARLERVGSTAQVPEGATQYVSVPHRAVLRTTTAPDSFGNSLAQEHFTNSVRRDFGDYSMTGTLEGHAYILASLSN